MSESSLQEYTNRGAVIAVRGSVVDALFERGVPAIRSILRAGMAGRVIIEVMAQLDAQRVRGIALTATQGLARGMPVEDTGGPLKVPVGKDISGRMFDVFGQPIDRLPPPAQVQWRSIHREPPPLSERSTTSEIFETGIKAIDVLVPLERGGKAGLFGGAGVGKTVLLTDLTIHDHGPYPVAVTEEDNWPPPRSGLAVSMVGRGVTVLVRFETERHDLGIHAGSQRQPQLRVGHPG